MITRTQRQQLGIKRWIKANGRGVCCYPTGFGKTRTALRAINLLLKRTPNAFILIIVPTEVLKNQWTEELIYLNLLSNCRVEIINSAIKKTWEVDLLVLDEVHLMASDTFRQIFSVVNYKLVLGLTGTLERLDGKEVIIKMYAPVCDTITMEEAINNKWVAPVKEYAVLLEVDLTEYREWEKKFYGYFSFFDYDFNLCMTLLKSIVERRRYAKRMQLPLQVVTTNVMGFMRALRERKKFIMSHPKKLEVARQIVDSRKNKKSIVFCSTIKDCEKLNRGYVLHSKQKKKHNEEVLAKFNDAETGVICSSKALNTGVDIKGLSVGIILNTNSSKIMRKQSRGRICRFEDGKEAELFTLLIKGTQEITWFNNASKGSKIITLAENELTNVLLGNEIETRQRESIDNKEYRF